jgi:hypothetical protein
MPELTGRFFEHFRDRLRVGIDWRTYWDVFELYRSSPPADFQDDEYAQYKG